jgi:small subunit ribosomal protein S20
MANLKNAKKRILVNERKNKVNSLYRASMKTAIKNTEKAILSGDAKTAKDALQVAIKRIDKAASKGVVTPNFVARKKSRLTKKVNEMK